MPERVEHLWTVICRSIHRDAQGLLSLDGLLDMVNVPNLPAERAQVEFGCYVASHWRRNLEPGVEFRQRVTFQRGDDARTRVQVAGPDTVRVAQRHLFTVVNQVRALPVEGYGQYFFVVEREVDDHWEAVTPTAGLWVPSAEMLAALN